MPDLTVIVPARNEAARIERCLRGLLAQDYANGRLRIIVVDDNSTDATASLVEQIAAADARVRLIRGRPLPEGWAGKPHACQQGADAAGADWLCFLDADTAPHPPCCVRPWPTYRKVRSIYCHWSRSRNSAALRKGSLFRRECS